VQIFKKGVPEQLPIFIELHTDETNLASSDSGPSLLEAGPS
jgi:hypothetical protein